MSAIFQMWFGFLQPPKVWYCQCRCSFLQTMGADFQLILSDVCKQTKKVHPCMQFYFIEKKIKNISLDFYDLVLTHWLPHQTVRDPPRISRRYLEYFRASESTKINHMRSNNRHKIRFQDFVYLRFNKWTGKC